MIDDVAAIREEMRIARTGYGGADEREERTAFLRANPRFDRARLGQARQRGINARLPFGIIGADRAHRQRQRQIRLFRDADIAAHQPARVCTQRDRCARAQTARRDDFDREKNFAGIAVIHQHIDGDAFGRRELQRAGCEARRQGPRDFGGLAGVAGIAPIGVPALADLLAQNDGEAVLRRDGRARGVERGFDIGDMRDLRARRRSKRGEREQESKRRSSPPVSG